MDTKTDIDRQGDVHASEATGKLAGAGRAIAAALLIPLVIFVALVLGTLSPAGATESAPPPPPKGFSYDLGLALGITSVDITNAHFGLGIGGLQSMDPKADYVYMKDVSRVEAYLAPRAGLRWETGSAGTIHGGVRVVGAATRGDGDPWFLTKEDPSHLGLDNLYVGWKSGDAIPALGKDGLEVSLGRQDFQLGNGMVLMDGNDEANENGAIYWLDPSKGWEYAGILRLNLAPVRLELFALNANKDSADDTIVGGNLELANAKAGTLGVSYFGIPSSDIAARDGMSVANVHGRIFPFFRFVPFPMLELAGEWNRQQNDNPKVEANAWFAEVIARLYMLPWYPAIGYRYASFSGDDAATGKEEGWDPLHYGATSQGFGYWYQGIVVGTYEGRPTNLDTHFVNLTLAPLVKDMQPVIWMKALYYDHRFNDKSTARLDAAAVTSDRFATEWDFMLGYSPSKNVDYMAIYGSAKPGQGGKDRTYGADKTETLIQFAILVHF